jgi:hypothetical protein
LPPIFPNFIDGEDTPRLNVEGSSCQKMSQELSRTTTISVAQKTKESLGTGPSKSFQQMMNKWQQQPKNLSADQQQRPVSTTP